MTVKNFLYLLFLVFLVNFAEAQNCIDVKGQGDFKNILFKYQQSDYKLQIQKEINLTSDKIVILNQEFSPDYDYYIGLVCSGTADATGVELRDDAGNQLLYDINYDQFRKNVTVIQFSADRERNCRILLNVIDKAHTATCGVFFIMAKEKDEKKFRTFTSLH